MFLAGVGLLGGVLVVVLVAGVALQLRAQLLAHTVSAQAWERESTVRGSARRETV